jgi:hypothetical protein
VPTREPDAQDALKREQPPPQQAPGGQDMMGAPSTDAQLAANIEAAAVEEETFVEVGVVLLGEQPVGRLAGRGPDPRTKRRDHCLSLRVWHCLVCRVPP